MIIFYLLLLLVRNEAIVIYIIAELAGADSLAAIYLYLKNNPEDIIIPTWIITPYELKENYKKVLDNYNIFINFLKKENYNIENPIILSNHKNLWNNLMSQDFISPCIACHLYCHLLRVHLAYKWNAKILTGERNKHNEDIKINQNNFILNYFEKLFNEHNLFFERPLLNISDSNKIQEILKDIPFNIKDKENFIKCSVKKEKFTQKDLNKKKFLEYLNNKLKPIVEEYIYECM